MSMQDLGDTNLQECPHLSFHLCCSVKGTSKLYIEIDQLMSLVGTTEWELWGFSQRPKAVGLRLGNPIPVDILAPPRRMLSCF